MRVIRVILWKELLDVTRNRRRFIWMLISSFLLAPVLLTAPFVFILIRASEQASSVTNIPIQGAEFAPDLMRYLEENGFHAIPSENISELILNKKYPAGLIIPADYEERIARGESAQVTIVADLRKSLDMTTSRLESHLTAYNNALLEERLLSHNFSPGFIKPLEVEKLNAASDTETTGSLLSLLIPGYIISIGLNAGLPLAVSTMAGEKSKLTLEPVLFTTVSRVKLVIAKLLAVLTAIALNFIGLLVMISITILILILVLLNAGPDIAAGMSVPQTTPAPVLNPANYSISPLAVILLLFSPIPIVLFSASLQLTVSVWARNDEEAYTFLMPLSFFSLIVMFAAFFMDELTPRLWHYCLPIFGTILSMRDLLSDKVDAASLAVMFASSFGFAALMLALAVWMFQREEAVFRT